MTFLLHVHNLHFSTFFFFLQLCDMESHCVIHIQILFKSVALHLHVKLRIWSQVACILIRGTTFIGGRFDIANKWDRVLIIVMKGVFYIVHRHNRVFSSHVMNRISFSTPSLSAQEMIILSSKRETKPRYHDLGQKLTTRWWLVHIPSKHFCIKEKNNTYNAVLIKGYVS